MEKNKQEKNRFNENNDTFSILPNAIYTLIIAPLIIYRSAIEIIFDTDNPRKERDYSFE